MATTRTRKQRGNETQNAVADWFRAHGWPHAESTGSGRAGVDVTGMPGLAPEVKSRREYKPLEWLRQAKSRPGLPFVVHRPDGMGPAKLAEWPVTIRLADFTALLRDAGYGEPRRQPADQDQTAVPRTLDAARTRLVSWGPVTDPPWPAEPGR